MITTPNVRICLQVSVLLTLAYFPPTIGWAQSSNNEIDRAGSSITPESMGFTAKTLETDDGLIRYYLSTGGRPLQSSEERPLVLYLDGSGPSPLFWGSGDQMGSTLMYVPGEFPDYHYAVISKPGIRFHESAQQLESEEYRRLLSLTWRVNAASAVIDDLVTEDFVDPNHILVVGHSEGADVAPWVALENENVTHVAGLAPGGVSQMFDFVLFVRRKVNAGELSKEEGDQQILAIKNAYREIFADPLATDKKWQGETYLRWSSFFRPAMEAWCQLEIPVYLGICRDDENTPVEAGEAIELEFTRMGKGNLTSKVWPTDHYFIEGPAGEKARPIDRRRKVLGELLEWAKSTQ